jgi:SM-20-related protein
MSDRTNLATGHMPRLRTGADARCPHVIFHDVLGAGCVAALLDHVYAKRDEFKPAVVRDRRSGERSVNRDVRNCLRLAEFAAFEGKINAFVRSIASQALDALRLAESSAEPREFELTAYCDGGYFSPHIDTDERTHRVRVLSCVYYFAATPRRFSGGELRLHGFPSLSAAQKSEPAPYVDIAPETDTLVAFPSWLRHEVLPVRIPSGAWEDQRFTINCWIHRATPVASVTPCAS